MPGQRELRTRIRSVRSTEKMTGAMRTISTAKYAKAVSAEKAFRPYAEACDRLLHSSGGQTIRGGSRKGAVTCLVALTGNRGLCGDYNKAVLACLREQLEKYPDAEVILCGRWGIQHYSKLGGEETVPYPVGDIPTWEEAAGLADRLRRKYEDGSYDRVIWVAQRQINLLTREAAAETLLPTGDVNPVGQAAIACHPDKETASARLAEICFRGKVYGHLLAGAVGVQGATMVAMRNAYDNARTAIGQLETKLNRIRQASVTTEVIETSGAKPDGQ